MLLNITFSISLVLCVITMGNAESFPPMGMVTGSSTGTYIQFGKQIANIGLSVGVEIEVKTSKGSLDNIHRIRSKENAALGIVQSDVLSFINKRSKDKELQKFVKNLRLIYPFYNEELHLYARKEIKSIKDLQDKRVAIGSEGSGTWLTSKTIFGILGVKPKEYVASMSYEEAAAAVIAGKLDAMIYVVGKPATLFTKLENVKMRTDLAPYFSNTHFVPIDQEEIFNQGYVLSKIGPSDYSWCDKEVPTVAVKAVLISYNFSKKSNYYQKTRCDQLKRLSTAIKNNIDAIKTKIDEEKDKEQKTWHPKWKEVNLDQKISLWQLDTCSRDSRSNVEQEILDAIMGDSK